MAIPGIALPMLLGGGKKPVTYVAAASTDNATGTGVIVSTPTGAQSGDLLVLLAAIPNTGGGAGWNSPSGWSTALNSSVSNMNLLVATRAHDGSTSSWTFTTGGSLPKWAALVACRGGVLDVVGSIGSDLSSGASIVTLPSITLAQGGSILLAHTCCVGNNAGAATTPTGFTGNVDVSDTASGSMASFYETLAASGATGTVSVGHNFKSNTCGVLVGIKPA